MLYIKVENNVPNENKIINFDGLRKEFSNVSFPAIPSDEHFLSRGYEPYVDSPMPYYEQGQKAVKSDTLSKVDGKWQYTWTVMPLTPEEQQKVTDGVAGSVREIRNRLLRDCDWTQGKDINVSVSSAWATYRQQLRDITEQDGFPYNVTWPQTP